MIFEFTASPHFNFIKEFSGQMDIPAQGNYLEIPKQMGEGYVRQITFDQEFRLLIHHNTLNEDLVIKRNPALEKNDFLSIFFYNNDQALNLKYNRRNTVHFSRDNDSAVHVTTNDLHSTIRFPAKTEIYYLVIGIRASKLRSLLSIKKANTTLKAITDETCSFLFFENMEVEALSILQKIAGADMNDMMNHFFVRIKTQELLYLLFDRLTRRSNTPYSNINSADAEQLLSIRREIVRDLSSPPVLKEMAQMADMSETKLKQLFKQTFGQTVYGYFQKERMKEAAFLLRQGNLSVSETGWRLGFSNLSHFGRLFKRYYNLTPKKYTSVG